MALIVWALLPVLAISFNVFDQAINYRADAYALSLTKDPRGLCSWLIGQEGGDAVAPGAIETLLFYDHPPLKSRLVQALRDQGLAPKS
jgi:Zn-dependent protease with chaperone function